MTFLSDHPSYDRYEVRSIQVPGGPIIGYEVRPLYRPLLYGRTDIITTQYQVGEGGKVVVYVRVDPLTENSLFYGGGGDDLMSGD